MNPPSVLQVTTKETILTLRNTQFKTFLLDNGLVLLHDISGKEPSLYYDVKADEIPHRASIKFGNRANHLVEMVQNRYLVAIAPGSVACYDMRSSKWVALPQRRNFANCSVGVKSELTTLMTKKGLCIFRTFGMGSAMRGVGEFLPWTSTEQGTSWKALSAFPGVKSATAVEVNSKIYLIGGAMNPSTWIYDPVDDSWTKGPTLKVPRCNAFALVINESTIVVLGGTHPSFRPQQQQAVFDVEMWNTLETKEFVVVDKVTKNLNSDRNNAVAIGQDIVLFGNGGFGNTATLTTIHIPLQVLSPDFLLPKDTPIPTASLEEEHRSILVGAPLLPDPPLGPITPTVSASVPGRIRALNDYASRLKSIQQQYNDKTFPETKNRIVAWHNRARDEAVEDAKRQADAWNANVGNRIEEVTEQLELMKTMVQNDTEFSKTVLEQYNEGDFDDDIPSQLRCPITLALMKDPVVAADGNTYDRTALEQWVRNHEIKGWSGDGTDKPVLSPLTGAPLSSTTFFSVHTLKGLCQDYEKRNKTKETQN